MRENDQAFRPCGIILDEGSEMSGQTKADLERMNVIRFHELRDALNRLLLRGLGLSIKNAP